MFKEIENCVKKIVDENITDKYELIDINYVKENNEFYLRIFFDKQGGFTLDDCEYISDIIGGKLDEIDIIDNPYYLEVSSAGIDRVLKKDSDFDREAGKLVDVKFYKKFEGEKEIVAKLLGLDDNNCINFEYEGKTYYINKNDIAKINLHVSI